MRNKDWADDWCDELLTFFLDHDGDESLLMPRIRFALLEAYAAGKRGESLFATNLPDPPKEPR